MKRLVLLLVPLIAISMGCSLFKKKDRKYPWRHLEQTTPAGYRVAFDNQGTLEPGKPWSKTLEEIHAEFEAAVDAAATHLAARYNGPDKATWIQYAKAHRWRIVDNAAFPDSGGVQWAGGEHIPRSQWGDLLWVRYYNHVPGNLLGIHWDPNGSELPPWPVGPTPPWTIREHPTRKHHWRYGKHDEYFDSVAHELGHHWKDNFQHPDRGWNDAAHRRN